VGVFQSSEIPLDFRKYLQKFLFVVYKKSRLCYNVVEYFQERRKNKEVSNDTKGHQQKIREKTAKKTHRASQADEFKGKIKETGIFASTGKPPDDQNGRKP
jgi:hypothetical protein